MAIKNRQSRKIGSTRYTTRRKTKQKRNTICAGHHYTQTNTNNVSKTAALLQTTGGKVKQNFILCGNRTGHDNMELRM